MTVVVYFTLTMIKELEFLNANLNMAKKDVKQKHTQVVFTKALFIERLLIIVSVGTQLVIMKRATILFIQLTSRVNLYRKVMFTFDMILDSESF